jgi:hypothetical protein
MPVFAVSRAQIHGSRFLSARLAPEARKDLGEGLIPAFRHQELHRVDRDAFAARQFEPAVRPIRQAVRMKERRRVHGGRVVVERKGNNRLKFDRSRSGVAWAGT